MSQRAAETSPDALLQRALTTMRALRRRVDELVSAQREPIAIVGMACRFPGPASDADGYWRVLEGAPALSRLDRRFDPAALRGVPEQAGLLTSISEFDPSVFGMAPKEAASLDPQQRLLLELSWEALEDAGYAPTAVPRQPVGVFVGVSSADFRELLPLDPDALDSHCATGSMTCMAAGRIAYTLGFEGPAMVVDTACSSSLVSVHLASQSLRQGESRIALAGGVSIIASPLGLQLAVKTAALSPKSECRPFDAAAGGLVRGEGGGMVVLKRLRDAIADRDRVLAVVRGTAVNQDGRSANLTAPSADAQIKLLQTALRNAGVDPSMLSYIEAHGGGTELGDPIELEALREVVGEVDGPRCYVGSAKANLGNLEAAAGMAGLIKVVLSMRHRRIPRQANFSRLNPHISLDGTRLAIATQSIPWTHSGPLVAGVSSLGLSGTNAHVVLEEAPAPAAAERIVDRSAHLLAISARSPEALAELAARLYSRLTSADPPGLGDVCCTAGSGRAHFRHRAALVASSATEMAARLQQLGDGGDVEGGVRGSAAVDGAPRVAFLFTGEGSEYVGMGRVLFDSIPEARRTLETCDQLLRPVLGGSLLEAMFPRDGATALLEQVRFAQPAIFALEYTVARLWMSWGVEPAAVLGYGVGEYAAACIAGVLSFEDALRLTAQRGAFIQERCEEGAMAAVSGDPAHIEAEMKRFATRFPTDLALAAINGPDEVVVSGRPAALGRLCAGLQGQGLTSRRLPVTRAFHSALMAPMLDELEKAARDISYARPRIPIVSNLTGRSVSGTELGRAAYWRAQAGAPVQFAAGLRALIAEGATALLEVGPAATLIGLARHTGASASLQLLSSLQPGRDDVHAILEALGALYVGGAEVDWEAYDKDFSRQRVELPTYPFQRRQLWLEPPAIPAPSAPAALLRFPSQASDPTVEPPAQEATAAADEVAAVEQRVREAVAGVMMMQPHEVEVHESLQALGLDSLMAVKLRSALREKLAVSVPLISFLNGASVAALARQIAEDRGSSPQASGAERIEPVAEAALEDTLDLPRIEPRPEDRLAPFPLTDMQQAYVLGRSGAFELGNISTYFQLEFDMSNVDLQRLERSFQRLVERHDQLRAVVEPDGTQRVLETVPPYEIQVADLRSLDSDARERQLLEIRRHMFDRVVDGTTWPLFEVRVSRTVGTRMRLHVGLDALAVDGASSSILFHDWSALYQDQALPALSLTYRDYVLAQAALEQTEPYERALAYWQERVSSLPPPPDLPLARDPSSIRAPRFTHRGGRLAATTWRRFKELAAEHGVTPSAAVCSVYAEVLAAWSRSSRFTLNLLTLNRLPMHEEVSALVGNFSATCLLEVDAAPGSSFADGARRLQHQLWSDLQHSLVSGVRVLREINRVQRTGARAAMPVVFASVLGAAGQSRTAPRGVFRGLAGVGDDLQSVHCSIRTPQVWLDHQIVEDAGELVLNWDAVEELFPDGMMAEVFQAYLERLEQLAAGASAWRRPADAVAPPMQLVTRSAVNRTGAPMREALLHDPFLERVAEDPHRVAVISPRRTLSYDEVDRMSERVAAWLHERGAAPDRLVAIAMEKGWEQVVAAVAVLKAGGAYVPVDPGLPAARLRHLLAHAEATCVLTQSHLETNIDWPDGAHVLAVDQYDELPEPMHRLRQTAGPRDLAYVIYTSGSTGLPKGVMIEHRSALNTILDVNERLQVTPSDRVLGLSSLSFDLSVYDLFGMLAAGGAVVLPAPDDAREPARWLAAVAEHRVTLWNSVPALMEMLVDHLSMQRWDEPLPLRTVMMSGDWIPLGLPPRIAEVAPGVTCLSLGGATEASIWSILYPIEAIDPAWTSIPYGTPMRNQRFEVLDEGLRPRPVWVPGDLYIAGEGLARGYWRDEDRSSASFFFHPLTGERLYRTGDLGRYLPDGTIEFLGRADFQVKVGGYRIELGEIEAALAQVAGVRAAVAVAAGERSARRLVAYVVPEPAAALSEDGVVDALRARIPSYAVPQQIVLLDALPLSSNGKVDRRALPDPSSLAPERSFVEARTESERALVGFWADLLQRDEIGVTDNFFDLGGQSLLAVRLMGLIRRRWGVTLPLATLFERPTVEKLAELVDDGATPRAPGGALVAMQTEGHRHPLFFVHPVGGDVLCYVDLAAAIGLDQPFYGLQAAEPASAASAAPTIEEMAASYVAALRERQPSGPYRIGGWSMGGVVAYEMCRQLRHAGDDIELVTLLDVIMTPSGRREPMDELALLSAFARDLAGLRRRTLQLDDAHLRTLAPEKRLDHVLERARACEVLPPEIDRDTMAGFFARFCGNYRAMLAYQAPPCDARMLFLRAADRGARPDVARAWASLAAQHEIVDVAGDHYAVTRRDGARSIAALIAARLDGRPGPGATENTPEGAGRPVGGGEATAVQ